MTEIIRIQFQKQQREAVEFVKQNRFHFRSHGMSNAEIDDHIRELGAPETLEENIKNELALRKIELQKKHLQGFIPIS